jgi:hypothetical protein
VVGLRVGNPPARATNVGAPGSLRHEGFAPSVCPRATGDIARGRDVCSEILARSGGEDVLCGAVSSHARRWGALARPNDGLLLRVPLRGHPRRPPSRDVWLRRRGHERRSRERVVSSARMRWRERGRGLTSRRANDRRAGLAAAATSHGKSERILRRTLRSPGAERSRLPYAAKPRGRGQAAEGGSAPTDRREKSEATTGCR